LIVPWWKVKKKKLSKYDEIAKYLKLSTLPPSFMG
jgi:hypothetical protein